MCARIFVENYECRTSTERAQHEAKRYIQCATLHYTLIIYIKLHLNYLYEKAKKIDEQAMQRISVNDTKRIIRVLEIYHATGKTKTQIECESRKNKPPFSYVIYGLYFDRAELYDRINQRVDQMMEQGLVEEVKQIQEKYQKFPTAMQAIGYKEVVDYLEGNCTKEEMVEKIKMETRRYAKRQMTWFRKIQEIQWIDGNQSMEEKLSIILGEK